MVAGLVILGIGNWREVMEMDIENAIHTYKIHYIQRYNENLEYEKAKAKK